MQKSVSRLDLIWKLTPRAVEGVPPPPFENRGSAFGAAVIGEVGLLWSQAAKASVAIKVISKPSSKGRRVMIHLSEVASLEMRRAVGCRNAQAARATVLGPKLD